MSMRILYFLLSLLVAQTWQTQWPADAAVGHAYTAAYGNDLSTQPATAGLISQFSPGQVYPWEWQDAGSGWAEEVEETEEEGKNRKVGSGQPASAPAAFSTALYPGHPGSFIRIPDPAWPTRHATVLFCTFRI